MNLTGLALLARFIPPPWGPIIAAAINVVPLIEQGMSVVDAINRADPNLLKHLNAAAKSLGIGPEAVATIAYAPGRMSPEDEKRWMDRASGGPR